MRKWCRDVKTWFIHFPAPLFVVSFIQNSNNFNIMLKKHYPVFHFDVLLIIRAVIMSPFPCDCALVLPHSQQSRSDCSQQRDNNSPQHQQQNRSRRTPRNTSLPLQSWLPTTRLLLQTRATWAKPWHCGAMQQHSAGLVQLLLLGCKI